MTNNKNKGTNPLAILAAVSLSLMGSQLGTAAIASDGGFKTQQPSNFSQTANQYLMAQNQQQCTVNSPSDARGGADLRNNPTGQNTGFINNGTAVNAEKLSDDGKWRWVVTPDGSQRGWIFQAYLKCSGGEPIREGSSNTTGGIAIGTMCSATGSPQFPNIPIQDFPNAQSNNIGNFAKGTQLRVVTPPEGQASPRKWTYVQSVQNPGQQGWVWRSYVSCN